MEFRCPRCRSLIYSRRSKVCGQCGTVLPPELVLTDEQAETLKQQRRWARELANNFGSAALGVSDGCHDHSSQSAGGKGEADSVSPEDLLDRLSYAEVFRRRPRPAFWLYAVGYGFPLFTLGVMSAAVSGLPLSGWLGVNSLTTLFRSAPVWLAMNGLVGLLLFAAWRRAAPICPKCRQNIRTCPATQCHVCGRLLVRGRCALCEVDHSWTGWFRPYSGGRLKWITYCPGCGVQLDSKIRRWQAGDRL